jgi:hypothetical protein
MGQGILASSVSYAGYALEAGLLIILINRGYTRRLAEVVFYLVTSLGVIAGRSYALHEYGFSSWQYGYCYWTTDLVLVLAAFVVVSSFFKRACSENKEMWRHLRVLLGFVVILVAGLSLFSLSSHQTRIYTFFIIEFSQNLYFACLVLTTLLYMLTLKMEIADERLGLLVCGLGIQFAGPAACMALLYITTRDQFSFFLTTYLVPSCDIGMSLTWFYAVTRVVTPVTASWGAHGKGERLLAPEEVLLRS